MRKYPIYDVTSEPEKPKQYAIVNYKSKVRNDPTKLIGYIDETHPWFNTQLIGYIDSIIPNGRCHDILYAVYLGSRSLWDNYVEEHILNK